jgi:hypothetical protein
MPDTTPPVPPTDSTPAEPAPARGYFNKEQLKDTALAESVLTAAQANQAQLATREIDAAFLTRYSDLTTESRRRTTAAAEEADDSEEATLETSATATALYIALQGIQSAAKQKHRMLAIDGDPTTNFPTDGYLMSVRMNQSRAILLQSAETLIARATADNLPGYKTPESIKAIDDLLRDYREDKSAQQQTTRSKELSRLNRDELVELLNHHRSAVQHAADALWPWSIEINRPTRKTFALPLNRPLNL